MTSIQPLLPFRFRRLNAAGGVVVSQSGDFLHVTNDELNTLVTEPLSLPTKTIAAARARFILRSERVEGQLRLLLSRMLARRETISSGPALHMIVPTLLCGHSCRYCQVSRAIGENGYSMSRANIAHACELIFQSNSSTLTVEFQGGDPLIRFDLVKETIERIAERNAHEGRNIRFVVASTLHQLTGEMCAFLRKHNVYLSTSIDGPRELHNLNRPIATKDSYERTLAGIRLAQKEIGPGSVSALMTTTKTSLPYAEAIVDEYASLGLSEIFVRPINCHGFARKRKVDNDYSIGEFAGFYRRAFDRVLHWNRQGVSLREV